MVIFLSQIVYVRYFYFNILLLYYTIANFKPQTANSGLRLREKKLVLLKGKTFVCVRILNGHRY